MYRDRSDSTGVWGVTQLYEVTWPWMPPRLGNATVVLVYSIFHLYSVRCDSRCSHWPLWVMVMGPGPAEILNMFVGLILSIDLFITLFPSVFWQGHKELTQGFHPRTNQAETCFTHTIYSHCVRLVMETAPRHALSWKDHEDF